jgi:hypothetical protein
MRRRDHRTEGGACDDQLLAQPGGARPRRRRKGRGGGRTAERRGRTAEPPTLAGASETAAAAQRTQGCAQGAGGCAGDSPTAQELAAAIPDRPCACAGAMAKACKRTSRAAAIATKPRARDVEQGDGAAMSGSIARIAVVGKGRGAGGAEGRRRERGIAPNRWEAPLDRAPRAEPETSVLAPFLPAKRRRRFEAALSPNAPQYADMVDEIHPLRLRRAIPGKIVRHASRK